MIRGRPLERRLAQSADALRNWTSTCMKRCKQASTTKLLLRFAHEAWRPSSLAGGRNAPISAAPSARRQPSDAWSASSYASSGHVTIVLASGTNVSRLPTKNLEGLAPWGLPPLSRFQRPCYGHDGKKLGETLGTRSHRLHL